MTSCASKQYSNLTYTVSGHRKHTFDLFVPEAKPLGPVLIFIHGGHWNSGSKDLYSLLGRQFASKGIITLVMNYRLSPEAGFQDMTQDVAMIQQWAEQNIQQYGGNPQKIFLAGHSAGGHLAALTATDSTYRVKSNVQHPPAGIILIDAFGLDIDTYLQEGHFPGDTAYFKTFGGSVENWREGSPMIKAHQDIPPFLVFTGANTYQVIKDGNQMFLNKLKTWQPDVQHTVVKGKNHIEMITQFINGKNPIYQQILNFIKDHD